MASVGLAARAQHQRAAPAPRTALVVALTLAGLAAAATSVVLALASDHVAEPGLQAALMDWITLPYIVGGLIAWWRRPESRFGPLMVAAGFAIFLSTLAWANHALPFTVGQAFDLLPAVLFLHVFLAFPDGRLRRGFERALLAAGYVIAFGLELVGMALGGFGPDNLLAVTAEPELAGVLLQVQLIALSALALAGIAVLAARRRSATRPPRRAVGLMIDAFALALVMIAVLFGLGAFDAPGFETVRRVTFFAIGLAPIAFLIALVSARLARSAVGDLVVELDREPAPGALRDALARALHDPTLTLAYWLPQFRSWVDDRGRGVPVPRAARGRSVRLIHRDGERVAALVHDPALDDEPELLDAVSAAAGIARRERPPARRAPGPARGAARLARPRDRGRPARARAARARPARRRAAAPRRRVARADAARAPLRRRPGRRAPRSPARAARSRCRSTSCAGSRAACTRRS